MSWKTKIVVPALAGLGGFKLTAFPKKDELLILAYHRIIPDHQHFLFDRGVISAAPSVFDDHINYLKKYYTFLSFKTLKQVLAGELKLTKPPVIITFDDGYLDNYTYAYPILKKHNACGTIFLAVDYIGTNRIFWWDEVAFSIHQTRQSRLSLVINGKEHQFQLTDKEKAIEGVLKLFKRASDAERIGLVKNIQETLGVNLRSYRFDRQILNWDEVRKMANDNMEFGSHTMTHPILSNVEDVKQLQYELKDSKQRIETETKVPVHVFSYPVGRKDSITQQVVDQVKGAGYEFATTYQHGVNHLAKNTDWFYLKRLDIDHYSWTKFKAKVSFPKMFKQ